MGPDRGVSNHGRQNGAQSGEQDPGTVLSLPLFVFLQIRSQTRRPDGVHEVDPKLASHRPRLARQGRCESSFGSTSCTHPGVEFGTEFVETQKETIVFASCRFCRCLCSPVAVLVGACVRQLPFWSVLVFASCRFGRCLCSPAAVLVGACVRRW